jgi:hypothetical protein
VLQAHHDVCAKLPYARAMTRRYAKQRFFKLRDEGGASLGNMEFDDCIFDNCRLCITNSPRRVSRVSNVVLRNPKEIGSFIGPSFVEDVLVEHLNTSSLLILWGTMFGRTRFVGPCGAVKLNRCVDLMNQDEATQGPFDKRRTDYYANLDWALDLRQAKFRLFELEGIPSRLILRDPETQFVVTRERALGPKWRKKISKTNKLYPSMIEDFLVGPDEDLTLIAPMGLTRKPQRDKALNELLELRKLGVAT